MYKIESIYESDIIEILAKLKESDFEIVFDSREMSDETRITVSPYDIGGYCGEYGLLYIDQLVFGEKLSPEIALIKDSNMDKWWITVLGKWMASMKIAFLTAAAPKVTNKGECLASRIVQRVTSIKND